MINQGVRRGFTLIELLISIAMLAIVVTASLSVVVRPLEEKLRMDAEYDILAGRSLLHAQLVEDTRECVSLELTDGGCSMETRSGRTIEYSLEGAILYRTEDGASVPLARRVSDFQAEWDEGRGLLKADIMFDSPPGRQALDFSCLLEVQSIAGGDGA